jgi:hypothetical protein
MRTLITGRLPDILLAPCIVELRTQDQDVNVDTFRAWLFNSGIKHTGFETTETSIHRAPIKAIVAFPNKDDANRLIEHAEKTRKGNLVWSDIITPPVLKIQAPQIRSQSYSGGHESYASLTVAFSPAERSDGFEFELESKALREERGIKNNENWWSADLASSLARKTADHLIHRFAASGRPASIRIQIQEILYRETFRWEWGAHYCLEQCLTEMLKDLNITAREAQ